MKSLETSLYACRPVHNRRQFSRAFFAIAWPSVRNFLFVVFVRTLLVAFVFLLARVLAFGAKMFVIPPCVMFFFSLLSLGVGKVACTTIYKEKEPLSLCSLSKCVICFNNNAHNFPCTFSTTPEKCSVRKGICWASSRQLKKNDMPRIKTALHADPLCFVDVSEASE